MRKHCWSRGPLLSGLFLSLLVAVSGSPTVAQAPDAAAQARSVARDALVSELLHRAETAYHNGDASFLEKLMPMAYAGGPKDDLRAVEFPPESGSPEDMLGYLSRRVRQLGTEGLVLLTTGADLIQTEKLENGVLRTARPEARVGTAYSNRESTELFRQVMPTGWWGCTMDYLSDIHNCWMGYNECTQPAPGGQPNISWCRELLDACMRNARQRYARCKGEDPIAY